MRAAGLAAAIHLYPIGPPQAVSATPPSSASSGRNRCAPVIAVARSARTGPVPGAQPEPMEGRRWMSQRAGLDVTSADGPIPRAAPGTRRRLTVAQSRLNMRPNTRISCTLIHASRG